MSENKNDLLKNYNELIKSYQVLNKTYENIIKDDPTPIKCSQIIYYNLSNCTHVYLNLCTPDFSKVLYSTDYSVGRNKMAHLQLNNTRLSVGTQFKVKTYSAICENRRCDIALEYQPDSSTVYFQIGPGLGTIVYLDTVPSPTYPPVLKCSQIYAETASSLAGVKYVLRKLSGEIVYTSSTIILYDHCTIDLSKININEGDQLRIKAEIVGASDSTGYIILEYDPTSTDTAYLRLHGNAFNTILIYIGRDDDAPY